MEVVDIKISQERYLISDLCSFLEGYLPSDQVSSVYGCYLFAAKAHITQTRQTGEPYIYHPIAVVRILAGLHMDHICLMAAMLHDVIEDTDIARAEIADKFGEDVAYLVDGVSKLSQIDFRSREEAKAASMYKMLLAMTKDVRVILIKLADRLHNMRTLGVMRPDKARRIAKETLDIYAPIASRLGINSVRIELEDLSCAAYWPYRSSVICSRLESQRGNRKELVSEVQQAICSRLEHENIEADVSGREKHLYSIFQKMRVKHLRFSQIGDVYAFRVIVDNVDTCYRVLGVLHNLYKPLLGRFKDYIAIPKTNGYQSLHTMLFGPNGLPIEIQIRTKDMHRLSESGIAAHWLYKTPDMYDIAAQGPGAQWLQNVLELHKQAGDSTEFLEHFQVDLNPDEVYVFTPRGKIIELRKGATALDFAYAIHSDVGDHALMARADHKVLPLKTRLRNGMTLDIVTSEDAFPKPEWLNFVTTGKARSAIRNFLKHLQQTDAVELGERMLAKTLRPLGYSLESVSAESVEQVLEELGVDSMEQLFLNIGLGNNVPLLVAKRLVDKQDKDALSDSASSGSVTRLDVKAPDSMVINYARCCRPIPGDSIHAIFSPGKGLVVHRDDCPNYNDLSRHGGSKLEMEWSEELGKEFTAELSINIGNEPGALATVASVIAATESNIENVKVIERDGQSSVLEFLVSTSGTKHLNKIIRRLEALSVVTKVTRPLG